MINSKLVDWLPFLEWFLNAIFIFSYVLLALSFKWPKISRTFYYYGMVFLIASSLFPLPRDTSWVFLTSTYVGVVQFLFADRFDTGLLFNFFYWVLQFQIVPRLHGQNLDGIAAFYGASILLLFLTVSMIAQNAIGILICNAEVSLTESWCFIRDCAQNNIMIDFKTKKVLFYKLSAEMKKTFLAPNGLIINELICSSDSIN